MHSVAFPDCRNHAARNGCGSDEDSPSKGGRKCGWETEQREHTQKPRAMQSTLETNGTLSENRGSLCILSCSTCEVVQVPGVAGVGRDNTQYKIILKSLLKTTAPQILFKQIHAPSGSWLPYPTALPQPSQEQRLSFHLCIASLALSMVTTEA